MYMQATKMEGARIVWGTTGVAEVPPQDSDGSFIWMIHFTISAYLCLLKHEVNVLICSNIRTLDVISLLNKW